MVHKNKRPKPINSKIIEPLKKKIPLGEYRMYSASSQIPAGVPWGGSDFQCVVVAASSYTGSEIPELPSDMAPHGNVYLWRGFRTIPSGSPPRKVEDCLYFQSSDGRAWRLHSKNSPDHHWYIMSGSGLSSLIQDHNLTCLRRREVILLITGLKEPT